MRTWRNWTYDNLISDNRSCRQHKSTWASEGTRTRPGFVARPSARAAYGKRINSHEKGCADGKNVQSDLYPSTRWFSLIKAGS